MKALVKSEMDIDLQMEGKDIRVKMGMGKKEHEQASLIKIKNFGDECKVSLR